MQKQKTEVTLPVAFMIAAIIFLMLMVIAFGIQNKHHRDVIEIYEEYYVLDEKMERLHREWARLYYGYDEEEFYLRNHTKTYLRYLELKKIIGEIEK